MPAARSAVELVWIVDQQEGGHKRLLDFLMRQCFMHNAIPLILAASSIHVLEKCGFVLEDLLAGFADFPTLIQCMASERPFPSGPRKPFGKRIRTSPPPGHTLLVLASDSEDPSSGTAPLPPPLRILTEQKVVIY